MNEDEGRKAIIDTVEHWIATPYTEVGAIAKAGANCATLMYGIARDANVLPAGVEQPRWYSPQMHAHSREERLIKCIEACGLKEIEEKDVKPGDVVAYLTGKSHGHLALIIEWPRKIFQTAQMTGAQYSHGKGGAWGGCQMKFYSLWPPNKIELPPEKEVTENAEQ